MILNKDLSDDIAKMQEKYGAKSLQDSVTHSRSSKLSDVAALVIFSVFTISVFAVLLFGINAFYNIQSLPLENHEERTALSFVWTRIKSAESSENVYVQDFHGIPALFIDEMIGDSLNHTIIYHYDGWVHELFFESGNTFFPRDGVRVFESGSLGFEQNDSGLIIATSDTMTLYISPVTESREVSN